ncbi:MAG TPA: YciI family protein [Bacteroidia bacterium]|jgi:hypothetical protein|nr:YciI family protein [Bacteroidia bacterium]
MEKFVYLFKGGVDNTQAVSPEAMQAHMQKWNEWMQKLVKDGTMLGGDPLHPNGKRISGTKKVVTDGPFAETKEVVGGYLLINANDLNHATEIAKGCPILEVDGQVEVRQVRPM